MNDAIVKRTLKISGNVMSLHNVDLNLFLVFDAIYQQRNLTRASEVLCMSQPAVSNALARLRESLNDPLFVRAPGGMRPTPMAENIIDQVQQGLKLFDSSVHAGSTFNPQSSQKTFRLSMNDMAQSRVLPELLTILKRIAPGVGLECYYVSRENLEKELASGEVDLALDVPLVSGPKICMQPLIQERYVCAVRQDHPEVHDDISLEKYLALDHIQVSNRRTGSGYEDFALQRLGLQRQIKLRVPHFQVAAKLVPSCDMILTLPFNLAQDYDLKILELPFPLTELDWSLYWHNSTDQDQANKWLRELLCDIYLN